MSTTTPAATTGLWHGLVALGQHMHAHQLSDPTEIQLEDGRLEANLPGHAAKQWLGSIHVDEIHHLNTYRSLEWTVAKGRLPESGVRVLLTWVQHAPVQVESPVQVGQTVAEVVSQLDPTQCARCEDCGQELGVGMPTHGAERLQTLCAECCHASNPCSHRACCEEGAIR